MSPVHGLIAAARRRFELQRFRFSRLLPSIFSEASRAIQFTNNFTSEKGFMAHLMPYLLRGAPEKSDKAFEIDKSVCWGA
jgi:hypothetical protein